MILFKKTAGISYGGQEAFALFNQRQLEIIDLLQTEDKVSVSELTQRFGNANAFGPVMQGLAAPVNDLSRGCSVNDIVSVIAITAAQANA